MKSRITFLIFGAALFVLPAHAQNSGGQRAQDSPSGIEAHMHPIAPTVFTMVDGQNDGVNVTGNSFVTMEQAAVLAKQPTEPSVAEAARLNAEDRKRRGLPSNNSLGLK